MEICQTQLEALEIRINQLIRITNQLISIITSMHNFGFWRPWKRTIFELFLGVLII
jgi:hypothetical protein